MTNWRLTVRCGECESRSQIGPSRFELFLNVVDWRTELQFTCPRCRAVCHTPLAFDDTSEDHEATILRSPRVKLSVMETS